MVGDESVGDEFAGYRIEGVIRHGGMATVYQARHLVLQRPAALKVLAPGLARDQRFRARFLGESRTAASLDHPHIVPIYDAGEAHGVLFIAMRLIEGADLRALLDSETQLEPRRTVALLAQVASALDAAHARGLVHRDVKPSNILVAAPDEHAYLADFGITKQLASEALTATSEFLGTIDYMCPEQIEGLSLDGRADVYALGCVLHECLTGVAPFAADTVVGVMHAHLTKPPPRPSVVNSALPIGLDLVVATAMAKSPADRHPTCAALVEAARAALDTPARRSTAPPFVRAVPGAPAPEPPPPPPPRRTRGPLAGLPRRWQALIAGLAAVALAGGVAAGTLHGPSRPAPPSPMTGALPSPQLSPLPLTGTTPAPTATTGASSPVPGVATVVTPTPSAPRPTATATTRATAGASPSPATGPPPPPPPPSSTPACEPAWSWTCVPPGTCRSIVYNADSGALPASTPGTGTGGRDFMVTVGTDGNLCAHWTNPGIQGELIGPNGPVPATSGANAGFIASHLTPGTYRVSLRHADPSTPDHTALQINT
jgi:serine/threonine protein kinase